MFKKLSQKKCSFIAGCIMLLYSIPKVWEYISFFALGQKFLTIDYINIPFRLLFLLISVMFLVKGDSLVIPISLLLISSIELYFWIPNISFIFYFFDFIFILRLSSFVSYMFLTVLSFLSFKNVKSNIYLLWFIPAVFSFLDIIIYSNVYSVTPIFVVLGIIRSIGFVFAGLYFAKNIAPEKEVVPDKSNNF